MSTDFLAYLRERFPPLANGLLILSYYGANHVLALAAVDASQPPVISGRLPAGSLVLLLMFFHLRVIDEHKDFDADRVVHPDRLLSRGRVTLAQLRRAAAIAIALEILVSLWLGPAAILVCLAVLGMSWAIYHDLFAPGFLGRHMVTSALLHLLIMPLYGLFAFAVATGRFPWDAPASVLLYCWVGYGVGLAYELARKTRAPADERPGLVTYSAVVGPYLSAYGALAALLGSGLVSLLVGRSLGLEPWYHAAVLVLLLIPIGVTLHFHWRARSRTAARLATAAGLFIVLFDWLMTFAILRVRGWTWSWL